MLCPGGRAYAPRFAQPVGSRPRGNYGKARRVERTLRGCQEGHYLRRGAPGWVVALVGLFVLATPARAEKCIADDASRLEVLGWLQVNGYLEGPPWNKLFENPPITGPLAGVDTLAYMDLYRRICDSTAASCPDSLTIPFGNWHPDSQRVFVERTWRPGLFGQFGPPDSTAPPDSLPPPPAPADSSRLMPDDFAYRGAFRVAGSALDWDGGRAMGFDPANGTLVITGADLQGKVIEIQPPTPSLSRVVSSLPVAATVATASDPMGMLWRVSGDTSRHGDATPLQLDDGSWVRVWTAGDYYDRDFTRFPRQVMGWYRPDWTGLRGPWYWGTQTKAWQSVGFGGKTMDYGSPIPLALRPLFGGANFASGRVREEYGEDVSCGPALHVGKLGNTAPATGSGVPITTILCYPTTGFVGENTVPPLALPGYSLTSNAPDMFWTGNTVGFGWIECVHVSHYFHDDGGGGLRDDAGVCGENKGYACGSEGDSAPAYVFRILLYDARELARVYRGEIPAHAPRPYASKTLSGNFFRAACRASGAGMAFDEAGGLLYLVEHDVEPNEKPVIHVWSTR